MRSSWIAAAGILLISRVLFTRGQDDGRANSTHPDSAAYSFVVVGCERLGPPIANSDALPVAPVDLVFGYTDAAESLERERHAWLALGRGPGIAAPTVHRSSDTAAYTLDFSDARFETLHEGTSGEDGAATMEAQLRSARARGISRLCGTRHDGPLRALVSNQMIAIHDASDQAHVRVRSPAAATWLVIVARDSAEFSLPLATTSPVRSELLDYTVVTIANSGRITAAHHAGRLAH